MLEYTGLECTFFYLILSDTVPHIEWNHDLELCCVVGWQLPYFKLLNGAGYFGGSQEQGGGSRRA